MNKKSFHFVSLSLSRGAAHYLRLDVWFVCFIRRVFRQVSALFSASFRASLWFGVRLQQQQQQQQHKQNQSNIGNSSNHGRTSNNGRATAAAAVLI